MSAQLNLEGLTNIVLNECSDKTANCKVRANRDVMVQRAENSDWMFFGTLNADIALEDAQQAIDAAFDALAQQSTLTFVTVRVSRDFGGSQDLSRDLAGFCEAYKEALERCYPEAEISVEPGSPLVDCDGDDGDVEGIKAIGEKVFETYEWSA